MTARSDLFPRDHDDEDDDAPPPRHRTRVPGEPPALPTPDDLPGEVATAPGPDLTPARTEEVEPPPGATDTHP
ncbi:hypothetical protein GCM10022222_60130 [Amycolatopsis ultiminotia]|uniref:Uncharacterized protein n=1 Tax=Amycolatopsis ultiminotia TaxID=543629 RepID=A0ABP6XK39_9PSEU